MVYYGIYIHTMEYYLAIKRNEIPSSRVEIRHMLQHVCVCVCAFTHVQLFATPSTLALHAPLLIEFSRQENWTGLSFPTPNMHEP